MSALRKKYLEAVLKQDVGFFDTDARTGDIVFSVSTDTLLVQDAISEKVITTLSLSLCVCVNSVSIYSRTVVTVKSIRFDYCGPKEGKNIIILVVGLSINAGPKELISHI